MLIDAQNIHKSFATQDGPLPVLRGVDLQLDKGETLALTGESGSGKSTLLYLIAGLDSVDDGTISVAGRQVHGLDDQGRAELRRETVGIVFQQFNLIPSLTVGDNLTFHARLAGRENEAWTAELAERLGLTDFLRRYPEQLSGGQQQRVAIGRALAGRPKVVLADEPTGNLDEETGEQVAQLLLDLVRDTGAGLLVVTHSLRLANRLNKRVHLANGKLA
ncbi:ABC transporter ATP-binding protein [Ahrensia sp. R2A130]|uniref:ABC transporter ATP-binding protein n=1 Tax=Ahrensia sp. R2A130 TaxID=744979 RepID=UPI0001E083A5|nr:ABC transporter ATP-binding protein [Ahrensia sp. R2A130]EFL90505.1 lipoprotein-releasing system ATP-binding protein LolD 1 [Ahrensia sp. R2A130]